MSGPYKLSQRSLDRMAGVHPDLVRVVKRAIELTTMDFAITEGLRTIEKQREYVRDGKSMTMHSRHLTGHAVDVVALRAGSVTWTASDYDPIAKAFKAAAVELGIAIAWGGDWKKFKDCPHFELSRIEYPAGGR
jgi:peptidoglycan L-alanyl-D-glutamate endopeptidase CwlK